MGCREEVRRRYYCDICDEDIDIKHPTCITFTCGERHFCNNCIDKIEEHLKYINYIEGD